MSAKKYLQNSFNDGKTDGIFMKMCREHFPLLPMEESEFFKKELSKVEKEVVHEHIKEYADKLVLIIVPLSTIKLFAQKYNTSYLLEQLLLESFPKELPLRSSLESSK